MINEESIAFLAACADVQTDYVGGKLYVNCCCTKKIFRAKFGKCECRLQSVSGLKWTHNLSINPDLIEVEATPCFITSSLTQKRISSVSDRLLTLSVTVMYTPPACHRAIDAIHPEITFNNLTCVMLCWNRAIDVESVPTLCSIESGGDKITTPPWPRGGPTYRSSKRNTVYKCRIIQVYSDPLNMQECCMCRK